MSSRKTLQKQLRLYREAMDILDEHLTISRTCPLDYEPWDDREPPSWCTSRAVYDPYDGDYDTACEGARHGTCWINATLEEVSGVAIVGSEWKLPPKWVRRKNPKV